MAPWVFSLAELWPGCAHSLGPCRGAVHGSMGVCAIHITVVLTVCTDQKWACHDPVPGVSHMVLLSLFI